MPRPPRIQYENAFYHVMNRGCGKRWIYHIDKYYEAFLRCLEETHDRYESRIHAYCLEVKALLGLIRADLSLTKCT